MLHGPCSSLCFTTSPRASGPLLVPIERLGDASAIGERTAALGIPVILVGVHYQHLADDISALERYPHLSVETSTLAHLGAIDQVVRRTGAERVLLGTGMPTRCPQRSMQFSWLSCRQRISRPVWAGMLLACSASRTYVSTI
jgi:hypothetical protein